MRIAPYGNRCQGPADFVGWVSPLSVIQHDMAEIGGKVHSIASDYAAQIPAMYLRKGSAVSQRFRFWLLHRVWRTSANLARLWQEQGKRNEDHDLFQPMYDWFTEGFNTKDLQEVQTLLRGMEG